MTFKFKVDENIPAEVAGLLISAGHDAVTVPEQQLGGCPDRDIMEVCRHESRAIVTLDLGFSNIRTYPPADHSGIVVLRLSRLDGSRRDRRFRAIINRALHQLA